MDWVRVVHVTAVFIWVGALMMNSRLFIDALKAEAPVRQYLAQRCFRMYQFIQMPTMWIAVVMGLILITQVNFQYKPGWFHMKLLFIVGMILADVVCGRYAAALARGESLGTPKKFHMLHGVIALCLVGVMVSLFVVRDRTGELKERLTKQMTSQTTEKVLAEKAQ